MSVIYTVHTVRWQKICLKNAKNSCAVSLQTNLLNLALSKPPLLKAAGVGCTARFRFRSETREIETKIVSPGSEKGDFSLVSHRCW